MKNSLLGPLVAAAIAFSTSACDPAQNTNADAGQAAKNTSAEASNQKIAELLASAEALSTAADLIKAAGLETVLDGKAPYTLFLPSNAALAALPTGELERLRSPENRPKLIALLRQHITPGIVTRNDLLSAMKANGGEARLASMAGTPLTFILSGEVIRIGANGPTLDGTELNGENGSIYTIDGLIPPE